MTSNRWTLTLLALALGAAGAVLPSEAAEYWCWNGALLRRVEVRGTDASPSGSCEVRYWRNAAAAGAGQSLWRSDRDPRLLRRPRSGVDRAAAVRRLEVHFQRASDTRRRSGRGPSASRGSPASGDVRRAHAATPAQIGGRGDFDGTALACRCANDPRRSASGSILARWCAPRAIRSATGTSFVCHCASGAVALRRRRLPRLALSRGS